MEKEPEAGGRKSEERKQRRFRQNIEDQEQVQRIMAEVIKKRQEKEMHETAFRVENDDSLVNFTDFPVDTDESLVNLSWADSEGNAKNYGHIDLLQPGLLLSIMEGNHFNIKEEPIFQVVDKRQGCLGTELCISDGEHKVWTRPGTV